MKLYKFLEMLTGDMQLMGEKDINILMGYDVKVYAPDKRGPCEVERIYADDDDRTINIDIG